MTACLDARQRVTSKSIVAVHQFMAMLRAPD